MTKDDAPLNPGHAGIKAKAYSPQHGIIVLTHRHVLAGGIDVANGALQQA